MDNDYPIDLDEIMKVLGEAEVVIFRFAIVGQRLLVDRRTSADEGPLVQLVPPARSAQERFLSLRRLRPRFPSPERVIVIHWPKFVDRLEASGVWSAIEQQVQAAGFAGGASMTKNALGELRRLERREVVKAIRGEEYQTIWHS